MNEAQEYYGRARFHARYPVAAQVIDELIADPNVTPELFNRICAAISDVAMRHTDHEPERTAEA